MNHIFESANQTIVQVVLISGVLACFYALFDGGARKFSSFLCLLVPVALALFFHFWEQLETGIRSFKAPSFLGLDRHSAEITKPVTKSASIEKELPPSTGNLNEFNTKKAPFSLEMRDGTLFSCSLVELSKETGLCNIRLIDGTQLTKSLNEISTNHASDIGLVVKEGSLILLDEPSSYIGVSPGSKVEVYRKDRFPTNNISDVLSKIPKGSKRSITSVRLWLDMEDNGFCFIELLESQ